mgnify:CR=1 FL=1
MGMSQAITDGIRVSVKSQYVPQRSQPEQGYFFFAYTVEIANVGDASAQLTTRHWVITNADGEIKEVHGDGVVGHTPLLQPGQAFQYTSFCPLNSEFGTMHGSFQMIRDDGSAFDAAVAAFALATPTAVN